MNVGFHYYDQGFDHKQTACTHRPDFIRKMTNSQTPSLPGPGSSHLLHLSRILFVIGLFVLPPVQALAMEHSHSAQQIVKTSIEVKSLDKIDSHNQSFRASFYLYMTWTDPDVCRDQQFIGRSDFWQKHWTPLLEFVNAADKVKPRRETYEIVDQESCEIQYWANITATFQNEMGLRKFPFDQQSFPIIIESYEYNLDKLRFVLDDPRVASGIQNNKPYNFCPKGVKECPYFTDMGTIYAIPEWGYTGLTIEHKTHEYSYEKTGYSRLVFKINMSRHYGFYLWKIMIPLTLIAALSWLIFLSDTTEFLKRFGSSLSLFLSSVAFSLVTKSSLPAVSYLVLIDYYTLGTYLMIFISAFVSMVVHKLALKAETSGNNIYHQRAILVDRWSLRLFPAIYFLYGGIFTYIILNN